MQSAKSDVIDKPDSPLCLTRELYDTTSSFSEMPSLDVRSVSDTEREEKQNNAKPVERKLLSYKYETADTQTPANATSKKEGVSTKVRSGEKRSKRRRERGVPYRATKRKHTENRAIPVIRITSTSSSSEDQQSEWPKKWWWDQIPHSQENAQRELHCGSTASTSETDLQNQTSSDENSIVYKDNNNNIDGPKKRWAGVVRRFKDAMLDNDIFNETGFQRLLKYDSDFATLVTAMNAQILEASKKQMFQIVRETRKEKSYTDRCREYSNIGSMDDHSDGELIALSTACEIFDSIAQENGIKFEEFITNIFKIMEMKLHKKNTLVFIGSSNSGKSFLGDLICAHYTEDEVGKTALPPTRNANQFWLESLVGTSVYRMEECFCAEETQLNDIKKLFEGNPALEANIKHKTAVTIHRKPVIVTMNGNDEADLTRGIQRERNTMKNRCFIYKMNKNIEERYTEGSLATCMKHKQYVMTKLWLKYGNWEEPSPEPKMLDICKNIVSKYI